MRRSVLSLLLAACACLLLSVSARAALVINANYVNAAGQTWDSTRTGIVEQAIGEWENSFTDTYSYNITFDFTNAGTAGYLGQCSTGYTAVVGSDIYPWSPVVERTIHLNADLMNPAIGTHMDFITAATVPNDVWDALSVLRHELAHAMGFSDAYVKSFSTPSELRLWSSHISGGIFDPDGLNVAMANTSHIAYGTGEEQDLMVPALTNGVRRGISQTDLDMLALAYGYNLVPEPSAIMGIALCGTLLLARRRRAA